MGGRPCCWRGRGEVKTQQCTREILKWLRGGQGGNNADGGVERSRRGYRTPLRILGGSQGWLRSSSQVFFFQAEDGIRGLIVTGVQTCALPISLGVFGTGRAWPDLVVAAIMASLAIWGSIEVFGQARGELRSA